MVTQSEILLYMAIALFAFGLITLCVGIFILVSRSMGKEVAAIASQTAKLAEKGLTEDVSGLVGNASGLMDALNSMVRTAAGIGVFLVFIGLILMGAAFYLVLQLAPIG